MKQIYILKIILQEIILTATYLSDDLDSQISTITAESGDIREKIIGFLKTNLEITKEQIYVCQYQKHANK